MNLQKKNEYVMTELDWNAFVDSIKDADVIFDESNDLVGNLIRFGTGDNDSFDPNHVYQRTPMGFFEPNKDSIEADGSAINAHNIQEYKERVMKGKTRLIAFRFRNLTDERRELIHKRWREQYHKKYDWGGIIWQSVVGLVHKASPLKGWLIDKIKYWGYNPHKALFCSQQVIDSTFYVDEYYKTITRDKDISVMNPECAFDRIYQICDFVNDSLRYVKKA